MPPKAKEEPGVTAKDAAALVGVKPEELTSAPPPRRLVVSQGVYEDLKRLRTVYDPFTGHRLQVDDDGRVGAFDRVTGESVDVEVVCPRIEAVTAR